MTERGQITRAANDALIDAKRNGDHLDPEQEQKADEVETKRSEDSKRRKKAGDEHAAKHGGRRSTDSKIQSARNNKTANRALHGTHRSPSAQKTYDDKKAARKAKTGKSSSETKLTGGRARWAALPAEKKRAEVVVNLASKLRKELGLPSAGYISNRPVSVRVQEYHELRTKAKATPEKGKEREKPAWWHEWRVILIGKGAASDLVGWD